MGYSEQFAAFREGRNLTREQLAKLCGRHRNTVINVEGGRPVKFETIASLMEKMGYSRESQETKLLALLWLEATTGIVVSQAEASKLRGAQSATTPHEPSDLGSRIRSMTRDEVDLLNFAVAHREIMAALRAIRALVRAPASRP